MSSVLQADIVTIGTRRYRRNPFKLSFQDDPSVIRPYVEETEEMFQELRKPSIEYEDEACGLDCKIKPQTGAKCRASEGEDYSGITVDKRSGAV